MMFLYSLDCGFDVLNSFKMSMRVSQVFSWKEGLENDEYV